MRVTRQSAAGFTLVELLVVVAIAGILATIAIPAFLQVRHSARRAEVRANLKALFVAERAHRAERGAYSSSMARVGFEPERGNRYAYKLSSGCIRARHRSTASENLDVDYRCVEVDTFRHPTATALPDCALDAVVLAGAFHACASGDLDGDGELDQWSVASYSRNAGSVSSGTSCAAGVSAPGEACLDSSDI